tara:strand:+ start:439 stop:3177 length:2739 start_codon:yes stop_codon:yes gene_type:complete
MSTQLILYPQNYSGYTFSSVALDEYFVNGQNFSQVNASPNILVTQPNAVQNAINSIAPSMVANTWYRYDTAAVVSTSEAFSNLYFSLTTTDDTGIIQKLSNLTVGAVYVVTYTFGTASGSPLVAYMYSGTVLQSTHTLVPSVSFTTDSFNFTAVTTSQFIVFNQQNTSLNILTSISITKQSQQSVEISGDGQVICDLYAEEDIPLTLSIDDFKNVAEKVQSYSKDFNLPATKRNNQIFNNMFEVTRADDGLIFNPYVKTKCVLKQDGFILFEGYLRLIDAKEKEGEISYNVNLYSEVIAVADILKESTFSQLDFTELEHLYNRTQIEHSWNDSPATSINYTNPNTSGFRDAYTTLRYPFIDWNHQFLIGQTSGSGNSATAGNPELATLEGAFRPCIQLKYLINKIFAAAGFNWTSNFFDSADFEKLYMDFNWGANNAPLDHDDIGEAFIDTVQVGTIPFVAIQTNDNTLPTQMNYSGGTYTAIQDNQTYNFDYSYAYSVALDVPWSGTFRWKMVKGGITSYINTTTVTGTGLIGIGLSNLAVIFGNLSEILNVGDTLTPEFKSDTAATNDFTLLIMGNTTNNIFGTVGTTYAGTSGPGTTNQTILQNLRGELGQWDFLKGIMTMFNLISMVDESNPDNILIEPYSDVFINNTNGGPGNLTLKARGIQHDWTDKVDASEMELKPLTDLNIKTIFKFVEDDDDYAFQVFKQALSGHLYGSKVHSASGLTILQGTEEIVAEPFAATVSKPLSSYLPAFIVPSLYALNEEGTSEGFDNSPRIFYNNGIKPTGASYYIPSQNGVTSDNETNFLQFSHLSDITTVAATRDFVFESSNLITALGTSPVNNLFSTYWQPYFNELYNADTRTMTLKVNLSPSDVSAFKFYDLVMIKNRTFRVNKIQYKPNSLATVEFILIP